MGQVKATRWLDAKEFLVKTYGQSEVDKVVEALSEEDQTLFSRPIIPVAWIDYSAYMRYMFMADRILGTGNYQVLAKSAHYACDKQFKGIYKFFVSFTSPEYVLKRVSQVWRQFHSAGTLTLVPKTEKTADLVLVGFPDIPKGHEYSHMPYMCRIMELSSAKNVKAIHPKCMARGDDQCLFKFKWE